MKPMVTCDNRYALCHSLCFNTRLPSNKTPCNIKVVMGTSAGHMNTDMKDRSINSSRIYVYRGTSISALGQINNSNTDIKKIQSRYEETHIIAAGLKSNINNANPIHNNFNVNFSRMCNSCGGTNIASVGQIDNSSMKFKKISYCYEGTHKTIANIDNNANSMRSNMYANFHPTFNDAITNFNNNRNRSCDRIHSNMNANKTNYRNDNARILTSASHDNRILSTKKILSCYDGTHKISAGVRYTNNAYPIQNSFNLNFNSNSNTNKIKTRMNVNKTYNSYDASNSPTSGGQTNRLVLSNDKRLKLNRSSDRDFYSFPRFVTHVDDAFISTLTDLYRERIPPGAEVLDLMSSWVSHLPPEIQYKKVVGHGLNAQELARNPRLDYFFVKDLNEDQTLEANDCSFDAVLCTVSVQYLQQPEKVFAEIYRILRPGGLCIVSFSNRMFYEKAISAWREGTDYSRIQLVVQYFQCVTGFTQPEVVKKLPGSEAKSLFGWVLGLLGRMANDPFNAVIAYRNFKPV
ncbi:hypothetical protein SUGI_0095380 [Cryptomeria japonica]|uniref:uncharacterized protein LOC131044650 n=1 Tax=Cryptomeria japonica TaxID=3369 RepID=UPI002408CEAC|nr:uncharacterized protein LOC131044650 [Cryptomeria japonica]GLJ08769.1 hypothetical protein SUGI_0095380 [Cryptomeria japonica]